MRHNNWGQGDSQFTHEIDEYLADDGIDLTVMKPGYSDTLHPGFRCPFETARDTNIRPRYLVRFEIRPIL